MRIKFLALVLAVASVCLLTSCEPDTSTENWLNYTIWEAPLEGVEYFSSPDNSVTLTGKKIKIYFTSTRLKIVGEGEGEGEGETEGVTTHFMFSMETEDPSLDYNYPTIGIPYFYQVSEEEYDVYYNVGTFSEDHKSLHFDEFIVPSKDMEWGYSFRFTDITFYK